MDSQPSSEGGDKEELEGGPTQGAPQQFGPPPSLPHPKESVVQTQEVTEIRPTLAAAPATVALPLPTGPRVTVPVGWKRIVLLDSVIYYR